MKSPEHALQVRCVQWLRHQYPYLRPLFFAVPNGGHRHKATAARMKAEGETAGVADLILLIPNEQHHSLSIEMKAGSSQSPDQRIYELCCHNSGQKYIICRSYEQFNADVEEYLLTVDKNIICRLKEIYRALEESRKEKARQEYQKLIKRTNNEN